MTAARYLSLVTITLLVAFHTSAPIEVSAQAGTTLIISEVHPTGSSNGTYAADWFEVTNTGVAAVDITGWKVDDSSNAFATAVALNGVTSIAPGQSVVFLETTSTSTTDAFKAAWFGSSVPSGLVLGTYSGAGIGLGNGGDAVNLFDAAGNRVTGVSFGAANAAATFDNSEGLALAATFSAAGVNGAFLSANGVETGSPGRRELTGVLSDLDLSLYVRVGRFDLPEPTRTPPPPDSLLAQEVSAVTYNWDTDTLFVVGDGGTSVVQVTKTGQLIDSMTLAQGSSPQGTEFYDPEGLTYVGNGRFVMAEERDRQFVLFTYGAGTTLTRSAARTVKLGTFVDNIGIEGLSYDPLTAGFVAVKETQPQGLFQTGVDFDAGTATNGSPTAANSVNLFTLVEPFAGLADFADIYALSNLPSTGSRYRDLLVLSQESGRIVHIDRSGNVLSALTIVSDPDNPLPLPNQQHEGLTMDRDRRLYVVSENGGGDFDHPQLWVYEKSAVPNLPPTDIFLTNQINSIAENTSTASRLKVADVAITDDGLGTNNLTVAGADAAAFEVDSTGLYIKAGTVLDFETKSVYNVTVQVNDPTVGTDPDATVIFALTVTDVVVEVPSTGSLIVSEVAPWSSGNSPVGADWFEVTNTGETAVNIAGWKVDDSSNAFSTAISLTGITSIAPGESVIFLESSASRPPATVIASFKSVWFGSHVPAGLQVGTYQGGGIGLSTDGDAVNLFDSGGTLRASVAFGASPGAAPFASFDNAAGLNNATISLLSVVGVNGAFAAATDVNEIGSPGTTGPPPGRLIVSEVAPWSSGNSPFRADWFEVTNVGASAVDITGWKVDDSSESPVAAVALTGITSIAPGESVIFIETANPAGVVPAFLDAWFGAGVPEGLQVGSYAGGGIGLSTDGDAVNLYDTASIRRAKVFFGASPAGPSFATFDNAAGLDNVAITQLSAAGIRGAFTAAGDVDEIGSPGTIAARVTISEVSPWSSSNTPYAADWFEVTNVGATPVDVTGWRMDDSSNAFPTSVALRGVTRIPAGRSAIFLEGAADGSTDATILANFSTAWAGAVLPSDFLVGFYGGPGAGLSTSGDAVNLFDALGTPITGVAFGASSAGFTFDNAEGLGSTSAPLPMLTVLSVVGVNGAFLAADAAETGSPGTIGVDPNTDDDGDGVASSAEIASAGTPAGNLLGSNPLNAISIPEVCDGADNDLNEAVNEGFVDTDSDGSKDCADGDDDGDGIADAVDPGPVSAGNETFSDGLAPLNGTTAGIILTRGGKTLAVDDATPNPGTGVTVEVGGAGNGLADIRLEGKTGIISLPTGVYTLTDPVATTTVAVNAGGPARIAMVLNGFPAVLEVSTASSVTFTETSSSSASLTGLTIDAVIGSVTLNDRPLTGPVTLAGPPANAQACKQGGWQTFDFPVTFRNQGECVSWVGSAGKPPKVKVPANQRLEATGPGGAIATFAATATDPLDGILPAACSPSSGSTFPLGETAVTCSATNGRGLSSSDTFRVWVRDTIAPHIMSVTSGVSVLPDTNQIVPVSIAVVVTDLADPAPVCSIVKVTAQGKDLDRDGVIDWRMTGNLTLEISANARRNRDRIYTITVRCTDAMSNPSKEKTAILVSRGN